MSEHFDENEVRKTIDTFKVPGALFEVRILGRNKKMVLSGYFHDDDALIDALSVMERSGHLAGSNVFYTINSIKDGCEGRVQANQFLQVSDTTVDNDILGYDWLLIDLDPRRPSSTSSTDEQLGKAKQKARQIYAYLRSRGFSDPVMACSGNGYHLQYRIGLVNTKDNTELVKKTLEAISLLFSDDEIDIDKSVFNPARITKLYGTLAQKGRSTATQPHRMSKIEYVPEVLKKVDAVYLRSLVEDVLPKPQPKMRYNNFNPKSFDVEEWMDRYGIQYRKESSGDFTKYILDHCPFNPEHKGKDAIVTRGRNGELGFKCLHNSCSGNHWQEFRLLFEPDAYEKQEQDDDHIEAGYEAYKQNRDTTTSFEQMLTDEGVLDETKLTAPKYLTPMMIYEMPEEVNEFIKTGITEVDKRMNGLIRGGTSVLTGLRGGSKSTILTQISLNVIQDGGTVLFHSFEMKDQTVMRWFNLMAAGRSYIVEYKKYPGKYFVTDPNRKRIAEWLGNHLMIYNNDFGNVYTKICAGILQEIKQAKPDLIVLDNLMALDLSGLDPRQDQYREQTKFVNELVAIAKQSNTHIIFVAHPRKANGFLRLDDISGTGNIANAVNNAFIVHRVNEDFKRLSKDMFHWKDDHIAYSGTNVIEIAKDREYGTQDFFIPLWYEPETKRLKNTKSEMIHYGWEPFEQISDSQERELPFGR